MEKLVLQLLELAEMDSVEHLMLPLDFSRLVAAGVLPFESIALERGGVLEYEITDGIELTGNQSQLEQLAAILLDNALGHCRRKGKVCAELTRTREKAVISVSSEGDVIRPEQASHLFERFYRGDDARLEHSGHYGLGLAVAEAITDAHRGKLFVESKNGFVIFTVELPLGLKRRRG